MRRVITGILVAIVASGCSALAPGGAPPEPAEAVVVERSNTVKASGNGRAQLEFGDFQHGYAMFLDAGRAELFRTGDGGQSWEPVAHPRPDAQNHQLYVADGQTVVLLAEPHGWYASKDRGDTWRWQAYDPAGEPPAEYPGYPSVAIDDRGQEWDVKVDVGLFEVTRNGEPVEVPWQSPHKVAYANLLTSPDRRDVWLAAYVDKTSAGGSRSVLAKVMGLPLLWHLVNDAWVPVSLAGVDEKPMWSYAVQPAGAGLLLLTTPEGMGYVGDGFTLIPGTPKLNWIGQLADGTLTGVDEGSGARYLSTGTGMDRDWIKVQLSRG